MLRSRAVSTSATGARADGGMKRARARGSDVGATPVEADRRGEPAGSDRGPLRVLISAYVCRPDSGSEPAVGWAFLRAAAQANDVILLTQAGDAPTVRAALRSEALRPVTVIGIPGPAGLRRFEGRLGLGHLDYLIWQYRAWRAARLLSDRIDVCHHVTFGNDWLPCAIHFLPSLPAVWGPVGGASPFPWRLLRYLSPAGLARELTREAVTRSSRALTAILVRRARCVVIAVNRDVEARFAGLDLPIFVEPHVALPPPPAAPAPQEPDRIRRAVFASRLSSWKGPYLALRAMAELPSHWHLDMYGLGSEARRIRRRVRRLGLNGRVRLLGQCPLEELRRALEGADVLLFPSMHDAAPYTVAEAVRFGCPVVCLDVGGPPMLIEGTSGIAVTPDSRAPVRLAEAMTRVRRQPPSDRWGSDRLAAAVSEWYATALRAGAGSTEAVTRG